MAVGGGARVTLVLGIDPGRASGWALVTHDEELRGCGTVVTAKERVAVVESALVIEPKIVVYAEKWTAGGWRSASSMMGLAAKWGAWEHAMEVEGIPARRVLRVYSQTWRAAILGGKQRSTEAWKATALSFCRLKWPGGEWMSDDAAEAACITLYGVRAERLRRKR